MNRENTFLEVLLVGLLSVMMIVLSLINIELFMNGTQSGKTIVFLWSMLLISLISFLYIIDRWKDLIFRFALIDVVLFAYLFLIISNTIVKKVPISSRLVELVGLSVLYFLLRQIRCKHYILLLVAVSVGGVVQAIYGNLQLWGIYSSHHSLFKLTGSFFNPGPYAGYLASVFPVVVGLYIFKLNLLTKASNSFMKFLAQMLNRVTNWIKIISPNFIIKFRKKNIAEEQNVKSDLANVSLFSSVFFIIGILMVLVLPATRSRAAWLAVLVSSFFLLSIRYQFKYKFFEFFNTKLKRAGVIILGIILLSITSFGIYHLKEGSSNGRILIWKVSLNMIKDQPLLGAGFDQFKANYMNYQANFFRDNPNVPEAIVAGDSNYAFNEVIQQTTENGIFSFLLIGLILFVIFSKSKNKKYEEAESNDDEKLIYITKAGIISVLIFSLFSYPTQILPVKLSLVLYLAIIGALSPRRMQIKLPEKLTGKITRQSLNVISGLVLLFLVIGGGKYIYNYQEAFANWKKAFKLYQFGAYSECLEDYKKAYPILRRNGEFLTNYGKALSMAERHNQAIEILESASESFPNTVVYTALGNSYQSIGKIKKAEEAYLQAWYMIPSRFYPLYLLAKLYDETGQTEKAVEIAYRILRKEVKVHSTAIEEIKEEMRKIIKRLSKFQCKNGIDENL